MHGLRIRPTNLSTYYMWNSMISLDFESVFKNIKGNYVTMIFYRDNYLLLKLKPLQALLLFQL